MNQERMGLRALARLAAWLAAILTLIALPLYAYKVSQKSEYMDFDVYYRAATRVSHWDWSQIYTLKDGTSPFRYAPALLPWFSGLAHFPRDSAKMVGFGLQILFFLGGFFAIDLMIRATSSATRKRREGNPAVLSAALVSYLMVFRLCLDTLTIGQITPVMFFFFAAAGAAFARRSGRPFLSAALLVPPALLKIGPAVLYGVFLSERPRRKLRAISGAAFTLLSLLLGSMLWLKAKGAPIRSLWSSWWMIVTEDERYYDASHYGSQSVKSFLLRLVHTGTLSASGAKTLLFIAIVMGCLAMIYFWAFRRPKGASGRALFFSTGVFPYLWFMPETFKYSLTPIAIPVASLFALGPKMSRMSRIGLALCVFFISLPGKDVVGDPLFFAIQRLSLPLLSTLVLGAACFYEASRRSKPSNLARTFGRLLSKPGLEPWARLPEADPEISLSILVPLPMDQTQCLPQGWLRSRMAELCKELGPNTEVLLIPFGDRVSRFHPLWIEAESTPGARLVEPGILDEAALSRGLALREGFLQARAANRIAFWNLEQPCDPVFFKDAESLIHAGKADLVRANRRLPNSRMRVPVRVLSQVYGRHRLGLYFNRLLKLWLSVPGEDTHSGSLLMRRELALRVFAYQSSGGFLFDLEISLIARGVEATESSLPVTIRFVEEKGYRRLVHETLAIALSLPRLASREKRGYYGKRSSSAQARSRELPSRITADDWGISPGVNSGILELVRLGVVRRVSIMARASYIKNGLPELLKLSQAGKVELGLHFDLTFGKSSPTRVLRRALLSRSQRAALEKEAQEEIRLQLAALKSAQIEPSYLDGHHHIHLVPGILEAIAPELKQAGIRHVRVPYDPGLWFSAKFPIALLCVRARKVLEVLGFESSRCFYPSMGYFLDPGRMQRALDRNGTSEVIVHPASESDFARLGIPDSYRDPRVTEFRALRMQALLYRTEAMPFREALT